MVTPEGQAGEGETTAILPLEPGEWDTASVAVCDESTAGQILWGPMTDDCGNTLQIRCSGAYCYKFEYNGRTVGECVYDNGMNLFAYRKDKQGKVFFSTWMLNYDEDPSLASEVGLTTDEGQLGKHDWAVWTYDCVSDPGVPGKGCRHGDEDFEDLANPQLHPESLGSDSDCED
jgi:hypothetical protein